MNIVILYAISEKEPRKTISDSLYCFSRYDKNNRYYYLNIYDVFSLRDASKEKKELQKISAIILHYSAVSMRYDVRWWRKNSKWIIEFLQSVDCERIVIPQDEYNHTSELHRIIKEGGVHRIYTCAFPFDYEILYPKSLGYKRIETVFTGYVDEETEERIKARSNISERPIDIGYRARKLPYWLGIHGQLKYILAERFKEYLESNESDLKCDIMNTDDSKEAFVGDDWIDFLLSCRTMLGCLGGSGLIDWDGTLRKEIDAFVDEHPDATYEDCEKRFFPGRDNEIHLFALSPRHFECAMAKTCQLLVEGDYCGVFLPGRDYIEIKKDFSNIDDVIERVKDQEYCRQIAEQCYEDVVASKKYTYKAFVRRIVSDEIMDKGDEELSTFEKLCKLSNVEVHGEYGVLNYRIIKEGGKYGIKRLMNPRYILLRVTKSAKSVVRRALSKTDIYVQLRKLIYKEV